MNQISVESNVAEIEVSEVRALSATHSDELITELHSSQLALIGGGTAGIFLS